MSDLATTVFCVRCWVVVEGRICGVQRATVNLWPGVDGADGFIGVLLDGLHSCWWQRWLALLLLSGCLWKAGRWRRGKRFCGVMVPWGTIGDGRERLGWRVRSYLAADWEKEMRGKATDLAKERGGSSGLLW
jgi:hypothetical protein